MAEKSRYSEGPPRGRRQEGREEAQNRQVGQKEVSSVDKFLSTGNAGPYGRGN